MPAYDSRLRPAYIPRIESAPEEVQPCASCERLKHRMSETIHASISADEATFSLAAVDAAISFNHLARLNQLSQLAAFEDYSRHIRESHP